MLEKVKELLQEVEKFVSKSEKETEEFRLKFLGKRGETNALFAALLCACTVGTLLLAPVVGAESFVQRSQIN